MGVGSVAVFSDADAGSLHVREADEAVRIGPAPAAAELPEHRRDPRRRQSSRRAGHPPRLRLPERERRVRRALRRRQALSSSGRTPATSATFGLKHHRARARPRERRAAGGRAPSCSATLTARSRPRGAVGYPVMLKATAGGGGIGMRVCARRRRRCARPSPPSRRLARQQFRAMAASSWSASCASARHIEVQIFGDGAGGCVALGERDCSLQRRNQKVIEETPAPHLPAATRAPLARAALRLGRAARYRSAGTVEFLYDPERDRLLLPRGEYPAAGRARRHRADHRRGPGRVDGARRGRRLELHGQLARRAPRRRLDPGAHLRRGSRPGFPPQQRRPDPGDVRAATRGSRPGWPTAAKSAPTTIPLLAKLIVTARDRDSRGARAASGARRYRGWHGLETNLDWLRAGRAQRGVRQPVRSSTARWHRRSSSRRRRCVC